MSGLIGAGLGVGVLPLPVVPEHGAPVFRPLSPGRSRPIGLAWHASPPPTAAAAAFVQHLTGSRNT